MTLQQLEYVVTLDTHRHFVTAANKCFVTQPTITLQLKKLEDEIGVQIFDRSKSPFEPTPMGESIILKARSIIAEVKQLKESINDERNNLEGSYRVGIIPTISPYIIPQFTGGFTKNYPDTVLDIEEMQSENIIEALEKNEVDIGVLVTPIGHNSMREIPLYHEPFVYYGDKSNMDKAISHKEVENREGLWLLNSGHCFRNQVLNICNASSNKNNINFKSGSIETIMKMVDNYGGFTLIPELASKNAFIEKTRFFQEPQPVREVSLVVHKGFVKESLLNAIRKEILAIIPESFEKNSRFIKVKWR